MITAIIQARVGSTRLPNKIFEELSGKPLLGHICERIAMSTKIRQIVIATTENPGDDIVETWASGQNIPVYRGSENDVLARFYHAATKFNASVIVRITADDPFKDPEIIDKVIEQLESDALDFAYNNKPPSFPEGLDTEVFTYKALSKAQTLSKEPYEREHVTQFFYRHPEQFRQGNLRNETDLSSLRWTIDTLPDLEMARRVYNELYPVKGVFLMNDILDLLKRNPEIALMNASVRRSDMYNHLNPA